MLEADPPADLNLEPYGPHAFLASGGNQAQRLAWARHFEVNRPIGFEEWVMGYDTLLLKYSKPVAISEVWPCFPEHTEDLEMHSTRSHHDLPIDYSGPDLEVVARHTKLSIEELIESHSAACYTVRFLGFSPGFAYLDGLPAELACPRLPSPRKRIAPGALAIGGKHTGLYPSASPGGWNWIGNCGEELVDSSSKTSPFRLLPGDTVRFLPL